MPTLPPLLWTDLPLYPAALEILQEKVRLTGPTVPAKIAAAGELAIADAAIVGSRMIFDAQAFAGAPQLKVVARAGIGYDNVDVAAATAAGVCVLNTPDAPTESTAEFAIALMFAVARRVCTADLNAKNGEWKFSPEVLGFDLAEKNLGLVGFGRIARRVAEIARAVRMRVHALDPFVPVSALADAGVSPCADLPELLQASNVLSLHAPLTAQTRGLIGSAQLALLPAGSILINTARGPLVDEPAVLAALESGHLAGAGLDVWSREPLPGDHPLFRHPRVVATPHIAAYTKEGQYRSHVAASRMVLGVLQGEAPATLLNPAVWTRRRQ